MPVILDFNEFLKQEVFYSNGYSYQLSTPVFPQKQNGQTCKLNALSVVLNSLHQAYHTPEPFPIQKNKDPSNLMSIRKLAKQYYNSQVGEVYSVKVLASIAADCGYQEVDIFTEENFENYVKKVVDAIAAKELPILFYDIDSHGEPIETNSLREHAVVVAGFFFNKKQEFCFIVSQCGQFYWHKAVDVFRSTSQLSSSRKPEVFYKYKAGWYDIHTMKYYPPELFADCPTQRRAAAQLPEGDGGLKNKILIIKKPDPSSSLSQSFFTTKNREYLFKKYLLDNNGLNKKDIVVRQSQGSNTLPGNERTGLIN